MTLASRWVCIGGLLALALRVGAEERALRVVTDARPDGKPPRLALVIGNSGYNPPLPNPVRDAEAMERLLKEFGFTVIIRKDASHQQMFSAIREFGDRLASDGVGLFYFAGHGMQVEGQNYLIPVASDIEREDEVPSRAIAADLVLSKMKSAKGGVNIVLLDACRNNPFQVSFRSGTKGLAMMSAPMGTFISYATAPGSVALDGTGTNGLYTTHVLRTLRVPGLTIEEAFKRVRRRVYEASSGRQVPWDMSSLRGDFYFLEANDPGCPAGMEMVANQCLPKIIKQCPPGLLFKESTGCVPVLVIAPQAVPPTTAAPRIRPTLTMADRASGGSAPVEVTDNQIGLLKRLIDSTSDYEPDKPELLFRMAELYAEQQRYYNLKARALDEKIVDAQGAGRTADVARMRAQQQDFENEEKALLLAAVKTYTDLVNGPRYQSYERMDQVLFFLAYLLTQVNREDQARQFFKRLIKDHPSSPYLPNAYLAFGEYYFEGKQLENALKFYDKVLSYRGSSVYDYALYKKGWVFYNMMNFTAALQTFIEVIESTADPKTKHGSGDAALAKEAKKDFVRVYTQLGTPENAWSLFLKHGKDYAPNMLVLLAELYDGQGRFAESTQVYRELVIRFGVSSGRVCYWQSSIYHNTVRITGSPNTADAERELLKLQAVRRSYPSRPCPQ